MFDMQSYILGLTTAMSNRQLLDAQLKENEIVLEVDSICCFADL
jgi:hypothetical protein